MLDKSPFDIPMLMERSASSIGNATKEMFQYIKQPLDEESSQSGDPVSFFINEVAQIVLDWMATGKIQEIRDLLENIDLALNDAAEDIHRLDSLAPDEKLTVELQSLGQFMAVFLRTSNLSKYFGLLSGKRREAWREALQWIYSYNQPVRVSDLCARGIFANNSTAGNALNQLADMGLLEKREEGSRGVVYDLTWPGRSVGKALQDSISIVGSSERRQEETSSVPKFSHISPEMEKRSLKAQETIEKEGFWSQEAIAA